MHDTDFEKFLLKNSLWCIAPGDISVFFQLDKNDSLQKLEYLEKKGLLKKLFVDKIDFQKDHKETFFSGSWYYPESPVLEWGGSVGLSGLMGKEDFWYVSLQTILNKYQILHSAPAILTVSTSGATCRYDADIGSVQFQHIDVNAYEDEYYTNNLYYDSYLDTWAATLELALRDFLQAKCSLGEIDKEMLKYVLEHEEELKKEDNIYTITLSKGDVYAKQSFALS